MSDISILSVPKANTKVAQGGTGGFSSGASFGLGGKSTTTSATSPTLPAGANGGLNSSSTIGDKVVEYAVPAVAALSAAALVVSFGKLFLRRNRHSRREEGTSNESTPPRSPQRNNVNGMPRVKSEMSNCSSSPREPGEKYHKMEEIGRGAYGVVYVGRHYRTGNLVAIKEMDQGVSEELRVEYSLMQGMSHPHIVDILGFEVRNGRAKLYLEWVACGSLHMVIEKYGAIEEDLLRSYVKQILLGLKFLHDRGILHRDIKPKNILVSHTGALKLTDFGLSRHASSMANATKAAGTPVYMAPECPRGRFSVGSDIWALGATMSEMATGEMPWAHIDPRIIEGGAMSLLFHIGNLQGQKGHHPTIPNFLSPNAKDFMEKCFAPYPEQRGSCDDLLNHPFVANESGDFSPQDSSQFPGSGGSGSGSAHEGGAGSMPPSRTKTNPYSSVASTAPANSISLTTDSSMRGTGYANKSPSPTTQYEDMTAEEDRQPSYFDEREPETEPSLPPAATAGFE